MQVDFAFLADAAEVSNGKLYVLGGAIDTIWTADVPKVHPHLAFAMRLEFTPAEVGREHKVEIRLMNEDGKNVATVGGSLEVGKNPKRPKGWSHHFLTVLNFGNLKFADYGDYSFEIIMNNSSVKSVPLRIAQRVELPAAG